MNKQQIKEIEELHKGLSQGLDEASDIVKDHALILRTLEEFRKGRDELLNWSIWDK